jgi:hypothetical protein
MSKDSERVHMARSHDDTSTSFRTELTAAEGELHPRLPESRHLPIPSYHCFIHLQTQTIPSIIAHL